MKLFILPLLIATISSNFFVHSEEFSKICKKLSDSLNVAMEGRILTAQPFSVNIFVASSEDFAGGMHQKMENFANELTKFVDASKTHRNLFPVNAFSQILNEEAINAFVREFTSTRDTTRAQELEVISVVILDAFNFL
jgi:hypothetical protein